MLAGFPAQHGLADKGYDSQTIVDAVEQSGAPAVIPPRACVKTPRDTDVALDAERSRIEGFFTKLKPDRAVATRDAKRARNFASLMSLASSRLWMK